MNRSNNKARSFVIAHHSAMNVPPKRPPKPRAPTKTAFQEEMYETIEVSLCPVGTGLQTSQKASRSMNPFELAAVNPFESSKFDDDEGDDTMTQQVIAKNPFIEDDIQPAVPASKPSSILEALKNSARKNRVRFAQLGSKRGYNPFDQEEQNVYSNSGPDSSTPSLAMSQESSSSQQQQQQRNSMQDSLSTTPPAGSPSKFHHVKRSSPEKKSDPARRERDRVQTEQDRQKFRNRLLRIEQSVDNYSDSSVHCISEDKENAVIRFLLSKRVFGYPGSTGSMWSNYKHFVYNNHPFLSICCLHSKHTYNCRERIVVFFNVLCFAIFLSFILLGTTLIKEVAMCRFGCNVQDVPPVNSTYVGSNAIALGIAPASSGATNETVCMGGYNDGLSYDTYHSGCQYYHPVWLSFVSGLVLTVYSSLLQFLATCACLQGRRTFQNNCIGRGMKYMVESCGSVVLAICTIISLILLTYSIIGVFVLGADDSILTNTLLSKLWSAFEWFGYSMPYFCLRYPGDRRQFYEEQEQKNGQTADSRHNGSVIVSVLSSQV